MPLKLNPSARLHRRYLLIHANSQEVIEKELQLYLGILGMTKASPVFLTHAKIKNAYVLAINRSELEKVRATCELTSKSIKIIKVSGTLAGLTR